MKRLVRVLLTVLGACWHTPLAAQDLTGRWELVITGPAATGQAGEMRFEGATARILLESSDSAFFPVSALQRSTDHIQFTLPAAGFQFQGTVTDSSMAGTIQVGGETALTWRAWRLRPGVDRWPVRPRLVVSQLFLGRNGTSVTIPGSWVAAMPARATLGTEYRARAVAAGLRAPGTGDLVAPDRMALGLDPEVRAAGRAVLEKIAAGPAADASFRELFGTPGHLRFDLHDRALENARVRLSQFRLDAVGRGIRALGGSLRPDADSLTIVAAAWSIWNQLENDTLTVRTAMRGLRLLDIDAANALDALLFGYDQARGWWEIAMRWLLTSPWLETPSGARSPSQLVATFWNRDSLPLPAIASVRFGGFEAYAVAGIGGFGDRLVRPGNAIAAEWLAGKGVGAALAPWRLMQGRTDSLALQAGPRVVRLTTPGGWSSVHGGALLPEQDLLRVDPGIAPLLAVATIIHEWQHLLFTAGRYRAPPRTDALGLHVLDEDPWLAEGSAEWATDEILAGAGPLAALPRFLDAAKRFALEQGGGDDPHPTGYRLVRAVAAKGVTSRLLRDRLIALMHDPAAFAAASGLQGNLGASPLRLERPIDAAVIPEISFTWDGGFADDVRRRLLIPPFPPEH